jgi:anaerobic magnesium-protoporphyrin IX monomethyl ester cyclase
MRVLLVGPDLEENLSLRYLASSLRAAGHEPRIAAFDSAADAPAVLAAADGTDLVGLSMCYQIRAQQFIALAADLKRALPRRPVIAGGHYASCAAAELLEHHPEIDVVGVHECEQTIVELASLPTWTPEALAKIPGLVYRAGGQVTKSPPRAALADLDELPWPERSGPARLMAGVPTAYLMGSRGCLGACDYCCITTMHRMVSGKRFRQRTPEDIAEEMAFLYHERGVRQFIFHDDNFLVPSVEGNLERIAALDRGLRRRRLRHIALALKCRPGDADRQVFLRLREMGLLRVFLGIESGSRAGLASIGRRQTIEQEHQALGLCEELGVSAQYTIIMFHPEATVRSMRQDLAFVAAHAGHPLSFCRAEIYTGTPLEKRMRHEGRAFGNYLAREYRYTDPLTHHAWNAAWTLLSRRCFAPDHLLGQIVRLDHQAVVLRHFYDGRDVDRLADEFATFELAANRETLAAIEAVFALCEAHPDPESAAFRAGYAELREREESRCDFLLRRACDFREAIAERSLGAMGLGRGRRVPLGDRRFLERLPRHAAAVFLAVGLMNCDSKSSIKTTKDAGADTTQAADGKPAGDAFRDQGGMFEAPPPRLDAPPEATPDLPPDSGSDSAADVGRDGGSDVKRDGADATSADTTAGEAGTVDVGTADTRDGFVDQGGMFEAPPPRLDAKQDTVTLADAVDAGKDAVFVDQGGMFEAPPPAMEAASSKKD